MSKKLRLLIAPIAIGVMTLVSCGGKSNGGNNNGGDNKQTSEVTEAKGGTVVKLGENEAQTNRLLSAFSGAATNATASVQDKGLTAKAYANFKKASAKLENLAFFSANIAEVGFDISDLSLSVGASAKGQEGAAELKYDGKVRAFATVQTPKQVAQEEATREPDAPIAIAQPEMEEKKADLTVNGGFNAKAYVKNDNLYVDLSDRSLLAFAASNYASVKNAAEAVGAEIDFQTMFGDNPTEALTNYWETFKLDKFYLPLAFVFGNNDEPQYRVATRGVEDGQEVHEEYEPDVNDIVWFAEDYVDFHLYEDNSAALNVKFALENVYDVMLKVMIRTDAATLADAKTAYAALTDEAKAQAKESFKSLIDLSAVEKASVNAYVAIDKDARLTKAELGVDAKGAYTVGEAEENKPACVFSFEVNGKVGAELKYDTVEYTVPEDLSAFVDGQSILAMLSGGENEPK